MLQMLQNKVIDFIAVTRYNKYIKKVEMKRK